MLRIAKHFALWITGFVFCGLPAHGKPLSTQECVQLVSEYTSLTSKGVVELLNEDPEEKKDQLAPEQLADISRFIFVEGQIRFRCPEVKFKDPSGGSAANQQALNAAAEPNAATGNINTAQPVLPVIERKVPLPRRKPKKPRVRR